MRKLLRIFSFALVLAFGRTNSYATTVSPPVPSMGTRLITLGTAAGPLVRINRSQPANVVVVRGVPYLFDAGNGVLRQLALAHVDFEDIHQIFLTHLHSDHDADVGTVFAMQWDLPGRGHRVDVYGPPGTKQLVAGFLSFFTRNAEIRQSDLDAPEEARRKLYPDPSTLLIAHDVAADGLIYEDANIKVTAAENSHYQFVPGTAAYGKDKSYAYRIKTPDKVIVFTGDTGPSSAVAQLAKGADILVSEVISVDQIMRRTLSQTIRNPTGMAAIRYHMQHEHLAPEEVGKLAAAAGVKMVVLSHVAPGEVDDPLSLYVAGVKRFFSGPVVLAHDLDVFE